MSFQHRWHVDIFTWMSDKVETYVKGKVWGQVIFAYHFPSQKKKNTYAKEQ